MRLPVLDYSRRQHAEQKPKSYLLRRVTALVLVALSLFGGAYVLVHSGGKGKWAGLAVLVLFTPIAGAQVIGIVIGVAVTAGLPGRVEKLLWGMAIVSGLLMTLIGIAQTG